MTQHSNILHLARCVHARWSLSTPRVYSHITFFMILKHVHS